MSRALALFVGVSLALAPAAARAADEPKDILAKAIKAHGGEEALTKYKAAQLKTKGKIDAPGVGEIEFTQEMSYMIPDKFRDSMELKVAGQTISIFTLVNGDKTTLEVNGKAMELPDSAKDSLKDAGNLIQISRLVPLKDKPYELSIIGEDKVEGKKVVGIRVSAKDKKDVSVYFDKETGLIAKVEHRTAEPMTGKEITEERIITEYGKDKNGIATAKKIVVKHDGKQFLEAEILEVTLLEKLDDSEFKK
jgi:hypothetical protein